MSGECCPETNRFSPSVAAPERSSLSSCTYGGPLSVAERVAERLHDALVPS